MSEEVTYYKHIEHLGPSGQDWELVAHLYRGFMLNRDPVYQFWNISYEDGTPVPLALRDRSYTDKTITHEAVDAFLRDEKKKQEAANKKP